MDVTVLTLIDITQTNARRGFGDKLEQNQQQNFNTFQQVSSLRLNPYNFTSSFEAISIDNLGFGDKYKGKQKVWKFTFNHDVAYGLDEQMLQEDFELIPIISDLNETIDINKSVIRTTDPYEKNILFTIGDQIDIHKATEQAIPKQDNKAN
jgi:hypothetical protein|tara:strand:- start:695 stop:1147 length:453 start_codon:yes stop_codon:yes gene_type:complete